MKKLKKNIRKMTHNDLPATVGLVKEVRQELKADIRSLEHKMNSQFKSLDSKFASIDSRFAGVDFRFERIESKLEKVIAITHRTQVLMEEQRGENRIVLDGLKTLIDRQDRVEVDVSGLQNTLQTLIRP